MTLEHALIDAGNRHGLVASTVAPRIAPPNRIIRELEERGVITHATAETINYLRHLRNQAAHHKGFSIDAEQALEYARLTKRVLDALNEEPARIPGVQVPG